MSIRKKMIMDFGKCNEFSEIRCKITRHGIYTKILPEIIFVFLIFPECTKKVFSF